VAIAFGSWAWISNQRLIHERELNQQRTRAQSEAEIALGEAERLYERAQAVPLRDLGDWRVARQAVTQAESLVHAGSLGSEMIERVSNLSNKIAVGETERNLVSAIARGKRESQRRDTIWWRIPPWNKRRWFPSCVKTVSTRRPAKIGNSLHANFSTIPRRYATKSSGPWTSGSYTPPTRKELGWPVSCKTRIVVRGDEPGGQRLRNRMR
jgi:hypothetical protein